MNGAVCTEGGEAPRWQGRDDSGVVLWRRPAPGPLFKNEQPLVVPSRHTFKMCRIRHRRLARIGRAAIAGLLLIRSPVSAQDVTEPALKAAFIYNFAKFTEWPAAPAQEPFVLCVLGDAAVGDALVQAVKAPSARRPEPERVVHHAR